MIDEAAIRYRWETVGSGLDERGRRLFAAGEVRTAGWGGLAIVSRITGLARSTINRGEDDLDAAPLPKGQVRRTGGGRKAVSQNDPGLVAELERLVEPATLGDPMRPLIWVSKSMDKLAATLTAMGHPITQRFALSRSKRDPTHAQNERRRRRSAIKRQTTRHPGPTSSASRNTSEPRSHLAGSMTVCGLAWLTLPGARRLAFKFTLTIAAQKVATL
jgi:Rhodopirellula transposase DDE domain